MLFFPSFAAHELMEVPDETAVFGDGDRNTGLRRNWPTALKTERMSFLREIPTNAHTIAYRKRAVYFFGNAPYWYAFGLRACHVSRQ
jgi:hypothetical protein